MMDFLTLAKERFSVRAYDKKPIEEEKMRRILQAAQYAPTAVNYQPQKIYLLKSEESHEVVKSLTKFYFECPVIAMMTYDENLAYKNKLEPSVNAGEMDGTIALTHMMLQAWEEGIGSCWVRGFNAKDMAKAFKLPENIQIVALLYMGYPAEGVEPFKLHSIYRPLEDMVEEL